MASPYVRVDADGRILADSEKHSAELSSYFDALRIGTISATAELDTHAETTTPGSLSGSETQDVIAVELVAGQTYTFSYRGTVEGGIEDPLLGLFDPEENLITQDDDGGFGRTSQITYTAATTGTYYLLATSWYHVDPSAPGYPDYRDSGDYTISIWTRDPAHDAPDTLAGAVEIDVGTTFAYLDSAADRDMYKIEATEGMVYTITYAGGISGAADWDGEPGENIGILRLYDENGTNIAAVVNYETGLSFIADRSGTYYVRAESYQGTSGGYTLDVEARNLADYDPLESLNWDSANNVPFVEVDGVPTAYVYFAPAGENFGETEPNSTEPMATFGWEQFQIDGVMRALEEYENILGVNYEITTDVNQATFRLVTTENDVFGARFYPQDPAYGDAQGIGFFNLLSGRFNDPDSLQPGGFSYAVVLHEFGHAHGIAHPHDTGGGSEVMLGVAGSDSLGIYDLNQGVYTVMSYNDGWVTHPDGERVFASGTFQAGWSATLGAFDIAVLQARYGVHDHNTGNDVYTIADSQDEASYQTIWDTGGVDEIRYSGNRNARIDLLAATLDYTPTGGGVVSFVDDIWGGYTIANGVVVENATAGGGDDAIIGNSAANILTGNGGDDVLMGREGGDTLNGGAGFDTASYMDADAGVHASLASQKGTVGDAAGDKYIGIEKLEGSNFADTLDGGNAD
ncbi:M10 family metallopeptidase C-terminal domain-containing protein, partial [Sphingosinicella sp. CPCC 101087]|uniref:M10 family metallopeptidase C-terminal domain-containing protein n=1 Tax=Sphingosinicella sp. CPCC 101087 TaxID=2497754 RepID=UPI00197E5272